MMTINRDTLVLLLEEMRRQHLNEVEVYHINTNDYCHDYDEAIVFRDKNWFERWMDEDEERDLLVLTRYKGYTDVSGSCVKWRE